MADDFYKIESSGLPDDTLVIGFRGSEGISRPYVFEIFFSIVSDDTKEFDLASGLEAKATLTADRQDGTAPFKFNGVFSELSIIHEMDGRAIVRALLVPKLWNLTQTLHSRIFTKKSIPDIIKATLEEGGLSSDDYELNLTGQYEPEEHVCQYRESDFDFISRWMEREGMYYFFSQGDAGEKLVIADSKSVHTPLDDSAIPFRPRTTHDTTGECLDSFVCRQRTLPAEIKLRDYDYSKPDYNVSGVAAVSKTGLGEINSYGARFFTADAGKRLAQTRAEDLLSRQIVFTASGTARYFRPGYYFTLQGHPRRTFDAKYLVTEVEHYGNQRAKTGETRVLTGLDSDEVYRVNITAIPSATQFRSEARAPWPRIYGTENGVIDGDADSPYAQIDDDGRYVVRFSFDESNLDDGKASTRVRMMQPHGGEVEGFHFPLRKGTEVMITFLGGDPDRPFIAGVVPNTVKPSVVGSRNHTQNIIRTGSKNQIVMEDEKGKEFIFISTPNKKSGIYMGVPTGVQSSVYSGEDDKQGTMPFKSPDAANPGGDQDASEGVAVAMSKVTDGDLGVFVGGASHTEVTGLEHTFVGGDVSHGYASTYELKVGAAATENYYSTRDVTTKGTLSDHVVGKVTQNYDAGREQTIGGGDNTCHWTTSATFDGPKLTETFPETKITASGSYTLSSPSVTSISSAGLTTTDLGTWVHKSAVTTMTTGPMLVNTAGPLTWISASTTVNWPNFTNVAANWVSSGFSTGSLYVFNLSYAAAAIQGYGLQLTGCGVNFGLGGLNISLYGMYMQNQGIHLGTKGIKAQVAGMWALV